MKQMKARLALCFGGRIAEQLIYGIDELNTGASNDIQQATDMARVDGDGIWHVARSSAGSATATIRTRSSSATASPRSQSVSEETARLIDQEVRRLIEEAEGVARKVLTDNLDELHRSPAPCSNMRR